MYLFCWLKKHYITTVKLLLITVHLPNIKFKLLPAVNGIFIFYLSQVGLLSMHTVLNIYIVIHITSTTQCCGA